MSTYDDYRTIDITIDGVNDYPAQIIVSTGDTDGRRIRAKFLVDGTPVTDATGAAIYYGSDNVPADSVTMTEETDGVYTGVIPTAAYAGKACATVTVGLKKGASIVMSRSIRLIIDHAFGDDAPDNIDGGQLEDAINRAETAADAAEDSATAAKTSETNAASSASAAKISETNAAASATAAQQAVDGFGLEVGTTTTGEPGTDAAVEIQKNGTKYTANFTIPRGDVGPADSSIMDLATKTYSGKSILGFGTIDGIIIDSDKYKKSLTYGYFINNDGNLMGNIGDKYCVVSDYVDLNVDNDADGVFIVTASRKYDTRIIGVYDESKTALGVYDSYDVSIKPPSESILYPQTFDNWVVSKASILLKYPSARYVRFGSYTNVVANFPLRLKVCVTNQKNRIAPWMKYIDDHMSDFINDQYSIGPTKLVSSDKFTVSGYFIRYDGTLQTDARSSCTEYIRIATLPDVFHVKIGVGYDTRAINVYDYYGTHLGSYDYWDIFASIGYYTVLDAFVYKAKLLAMYPEAYFIRFCNYAVGINLESVSINNAVKKGPIDFTKSDILYGKKYVICGDSFSAELDTNGGRPYGKVIAERNNMSYVNLAIAGTTMSTDVDHDSFANTQYKKVPADADYITLCYGLNEESAIPDHIGEKTSTDISTIWGAWNFSMKYLITNMPFAKIGIIIADAWTSQQMHDLLVEIAEYWGIPYLDLKGSTSVPMGLNGRLPSGAVNSEAVTLRTNAFRVSDSDGHPNQKAHEYRSTVIENFLRSL